MSPFDRALGVSEGRFNNEDEDDNDGVGTVSGIGAAPPV